MKASTDFVASDPMIPTVRRIAVVASVRLADHEQSCDQCSKVIGLVTYKALMLRCAQGRVLSVNANRADSVLIRLLEQQLAAQSLPALPLAVAASLETHPAPRPRRTPARRAASTVAAASVNGEPR